MNLDDLKFSNKSVTYSNDCNFVADSSSEAFEKTAICDTPAAERKKSGNAPPLIITQEPPSADGTSDEDDDHVIEETSTRSRSQSIQLSKSKYGSKGALHSPVGSAHSFDLQVKFISSL